MAACGDDAGFEGGGATIEQTIPASVSRLTPFQFERAVTVDWTTQVSGVRVTGGDGLPIDTITRLEVRVVGTGTARTLVDAYETAFGPGATSARLTAEVPFVGADIDGYAADDDYDNDFVENAVDNCPSIQNNTQDDADADGVGAACDPDDADPLVGPEHASSGLPPLTFRFRVFGDGQAMPEGGLPLDISLSGAGRMDVRL